MQIGRPDHYRTAYDGAHGAKQQLKAAAFSTRDAAAVARPDFNPAITHARQAIAMIDDISQVTGGMSQRIRSDFALARNEALEGIAAISTNVLSIAGRGDAADADGAIRRFTASSAALGNAARLIRVEAGWNWTPRLEQLHA